MSTFVAPSRSGADAWGPWQTVAWALGVAVLFVLMQVVSVWVYVGVSSWLAPETVPNESALGLHTNGLLLSLATLATAPVCLLAIGAIVRRRTRAVQDYLAWRKLSPGAGLWRWFGYGALLIAVADSLTWLAGRPLVPDFMRDTYMTAGWAPLYWLAVVGVAPLFEEIFFRGFLFRGLESSRLGAAGTVIVTALVWALVHTQYDLFELTIVLAGGLYLGWVRLRTGSARLTYGLHAFWNLVAVIQVALVAAGWA
jgi:membrane protease YdiL (CAAX protease family)